MVARPEFHGEGLGIIPSFFLNVGTIHFSSCRSDLFLLSAVHCGAVCLL